MTVRSIHENTFLFYATARLQFIATLVAKNTRPAVLPIDNLRLKQVGAIPTVSRSLLPFRTAKAF